MLQLGWARQRQDRDHARCRSNQKEGSEDPDLSLLKEKVIVRDGNPAL